MTVLKPPKGRPPPEPVRFPPKEPFEWWLIPASIVGIAIVVLVAVTRPEPPPPDPRPCESWNQMWTDLRRSSEEFDARYGTELERLRQEFAKREPEVRDRVYANLDRMEAEGKFDRAPLVLEECTPDGLFVSPVFKRR
jgi:hypothetical protein